MPELRQINQFGVGWVTQIVPFQNSASVRDVPVLSPVLPTATQASELLQETSAGDACCVRLGVLSMLHDMLFHASPRVESV